MEMGTRCAWQCLKQLAESFGRIGNSSRFDGTQAEVVGRYYGGVREGLTSLLYNGPAGGAVVRLRSLNRSLSAGTGWRSSRLKLKNGSDRAVAGLGGRNSHSGCSTLVRSELQQLSVVCSSRQVILSPKRNLSSETWTERWKASIQKAKDGLNLKTQKSSGGVTAVKSGVAQGHAKEVLAEASSSVQRTLSHYREAVGLQVEAFWKRNYLVVVGFVGLGVCLLLWRVMYGVASLFISMSEGLAKFGFLALAAAMVIVGGVVLRARFIINPDSVYRIAMRKLNTSAAVLEVMGAPLSGTDLRAYIMSGGGLRLKNFRPRLAGKRCFIIFPIRGAERRGLVSLEVKKKKGQYDFKLLAVDVPTAGDDQRLYLIGDENEYKVGGGIISELRDPIVKAMAAQKELEELDMREEEEDELKAVEAEQRRVEELEQLARESEQAELENQEDAKAEEQKKEKILA